jgi:hypothetical protein
MISFRGFSPRWAGSIVLCLRQGRTPWQWEHLVEEAVYLVVSRKHKETEWKRLGIDIAFKGIPPAIYLL